MDGFRLDVANAFLHDKKLADNPAIPAAQRGAVDWSAAANMQRHLNDSNLEQNKPLLDVIRKRAEAFEDRFVFGEFSEEFERSGCYLPSDQGLHAGYNFALLLAGDAAAIRAHLETLAQFPDHWPCVAFSNHDVIRTASRFGPQSAKAMLALLFSLRGTVLLYQGEELGLPEVTLRRDQLKDPVGDLYYPLFKGRDGCRTPDAVGRGQVSTLGFSAAHTPACCWTRACRALSRPRSRKAIPIPPLAYSRKLLAARKAHPALLDGTLELLPGPLLGFIREAPARNRSSCVFKPDRPGSRRDHAELLGCSHMKPLDLGTGKAILSGNALTLDGHGAWFGLL